MTEHEHKRLSPAAKATIGAAAIFGTVMVVRELPDLVRYLRLRQL